MVEKINLLDEANQTEKLFAYRKIGALNNHVLHVLQASDRTLDFHVHGDSDELFYVIEGEFALEFEDGKVPLSAGEMIIVPRGVSHRPVCTSLVKCLLVEMDGTLSKENTGGAYGE